MVDPTAPHRRLREAHAHLFQHGRAMGMLQLADCRGVNDCLERLARAAQAAGASGAPSSRWLLGVGLRVESWSEPRYPTVEELDAAAGNRPLCMWSFDHHALVVNTSALAATGIAADTPDPGNGRIVRDARGKPTGLMLERAAKLVWERIPEPSYAERRELVLEALQDLAGHGFVEVHDLLSPPWLGPLLGELEDDGELSMRVRLYPAMADLDRVLEARERWDRGLVRLAGAKLFADGTLNSRTAWMLHPYADPLPGLPTGQPMLTQAELGAALERVRSLGLGLAVHAIGDAAVRAVLDACEATIDQRQSPGRPLLRIEHAEVIDEADVPRFARLGVVASVQPCHLLTDIEVLRRSLPHRLHRVLPLRELIDSGLHHDLLLFGSDTPIVRPHPQDSIQAAVHRRRGEMKPAEALAPEQAITEGEAWRAFAAGA